MALQNALRFGSMVISLRCGRFLQAPSTGGIKTRNLLSRQGFFEEQINCQCFDPSTIQLWMSTLFFI